MPRVGRKAYILSSTVAFVPHPHVPGFYVRTHAAVLLTACEVCGSKTGQLCTSLASSQPARRGREIFSTHWRRRRALADLKIELPAEVTLAEPAIGLPPAPEIQVRGGIRKRCG